MPKPQRTSAASQASDTCIDFEGTESLTVVQFSAPDPLPGVDLDTFVTQLCLGVARERHRRRPDHAPWCVWLAVDQPSNERRHSWIGFGSSATSLALPVESALTDLGCDTHRERGELATIGFRPLFRFRADGIDVPERAPVEANTLFNGLDMQRVPFCVSLAELWKRDLLARLMLSDHPSPLLELPYYRDDAAAEYVLGRVELQMFMRLPDGTVIAASRASETPAVVLTFELSPARTLELLEILPPTARHDIANSLMGSRPLKVAPGTCVVGIRAHADAPDPNGSRSYIVHAVFHATPGRMRMEVRF